MDREHGGGGVTGWQGGSGLAKVLPLGPALTNRGLWRYSDTLSAILSPSVESRTHWKPNIGSQNVCNIERVW